MGEGQAMRLRGRRTKQRGLMELADKMVTHSMQGAMLCWYARKCQGECDSSERTASGHVLKNECLGARRRLASWLSLCAS